MKYIEKLLKGAEVKWVPLGEVCAIKTGKGVTKNDANSNGIYPIISGGKTPMDYIDIYNRQANTVTVSRVGANAGFVSYIKEKFYLNDKCFSVIPKSSNSIVSRFLYYALKSQELKISALQSEGGVPTINTTKLGNVTIPVPPFHVQEEIVRILDKFTTLETELETELDCRKRQYEYYRNHLLSLDGINSIESFDEVEWVPLGEVTTYKQPTKYLVKSTNYNNSFTTPVLTAGKTFVLGYTNEEDGIYKASASPVIIFDDFTTANKWVDFDFKAKSSAMKMIISKDESKVLLKYIYHWLNTLPSELVEGDHKRQWISNFCKKSFPIPPLAEQQRIVSILDKFEALTTSISEGLPKEIELRRKQYEYYRNQLLSFA